MHYSRELILEDFFKQNLFIWISFLVVSSGLINIIKMLKTNKA